MLNKEIKVDLIEITESNAIQVRTATIITEDDTELSRSYHRHVLQQNDDLTGQDPKVVKIANAIWS